MLVVGPDEDEVIVIGKQDQGTEEWNALASRPGIRVVALARMGLLKMSKRVSSSNRGT